MVVFGNDEVLVIQITFASFFSLATSVATSGTLMPAPRLGGSLTFSVLRRGVTSTPRSAGLTTSSVLLLGLHDVGQRHVARLVQAQVGGDDRRQLDLERLQAAVDLARDGGDAVGDLDLGREGGLRQVGQRGEHLAGLVAVVVDGLLAEDDEAAAAPCRPAPSAAWRPPAAAVRRRTRPGSRGRRRWPSRCAASPGTAWTPHDTAMTSVATPFSFSRTASSTAISSKGFMLILTLAMSTPRAVGLDAHLDVVVDDPLDGDQNLHRAAPAEQDRSNDRAILAPALGVSRRAGAVTQPPARRAPCDPAARVPRGRSFRAPRCQGAEAGVRDAQAAGRRRRIAPRRSAR